MSQAIASRATLQDVISLIENEKISSRQKQDLCSAVRTVAKALGAEPAQILADPPLLRRRLEGLSAEVLGLSRGRWANTPDCLALNGRSATLFLDG